MSVRITDNKGMGDRYEEILFAEARAKHRRSCHTLRSAKRSSDDDTDDGPDAKAQQHIPDKIHLTHCLFQPMLYYEQGRRARHSFA
jgi:hypothetical protein